MADVYYTGAAQPVPRVERVAVTTAAAGAVYTVTVVGSNKFFRYTAVTGDTTTTIAAALLQAMQASTDGEVRELTGEVDPTDATRFYVTGPADGAPFSLSVGATGGGAITTTPITTETGPHHLDNVLNYSTGALPVDTDRLILRTGTRGPKYELDALDAVDLTELLRYRSFTGGVGLPDTSANGYPEYRPKYFECKAPVVYVEQAATDGPGAVRIESTSSAAVAVTVAGLGVGQGGGTLAAPAFDVHALPADSTIKGTGASVGLAVGDGQAGVADAIDVSNGAVFVGPGATIEGVTLSNCQGEIAAGYKTLTVSGEASDVAVTGAAGSTQADGTVVNEGAVRWRSTAKPGTSAVVGSGGTLDMTQAPAAVAAFTVKMHAGSTLDNSNERITRPFSVSPQQCTVQELTIKSGNAAGLIDFN